MSDETNEQEEFFQEEDTMSMSSKESEILQSYELSQEKEDEEGLDDYEDFVDEGLLERNRRRQRIRNIIFAIILIIIILIAIDVIAVAYYNKGPFFAIPGVQYKDGGTREYYGLGYKVISYHQVQGRRDKELGFWNLEYNTSAITIKDIDLAIGMVDKEEFYQKYHKKFVRIISTLHGVNMNSHQITLGYIDEDGKYSLDIICNMVEDQNDLDIFEVEKPITIIGTIKERRNQTIYVSNCFAEQ
ncbi:MAG: hypothetical protein IJI60_01660 [Bacilli bacterium]|nr:hypothetical protein [Bacilli bacterium]